MTERPPSTLDRLWHDLETTEAPIYQILARAKTARRRKNGAVVAVTAMSVAAVLAGIAATTVPGVDDQAPDTSASDPSPHRLVGTGRVAIRLPANAQACQLPASDAVTFTISGGCDPERRHERIDVQISDAPMWSDNSLEGWLRFERELEGYDVLAAPITCTRGGIGSCSKVFAIPELDVYVAVRFPLMDDVTDGDLPQEISDSLTILPSDQVVVPIIPMGTRAAQAERLLSIAGLRAELSEDRCPSHFTCMSGVVATEPEAGSVVEVGDTITMLR